ncbi:alpha/beta fold hydrolase [Sandaracinus amylolyticus]|uniref:Alpha/beta hydrolase n=1 Tax=Sandaracinus amylolyticus TaxID=927083 RepID=A0A0F6W9G2_9BACT|nr:alpha/beta fold hydrolase [Sandaracinus amylolyticus]AKF10752.1 Alpha/beta hydrolase [Sandaracinus amylolyticus]
MEMLGHARVVRVNDCDVAWGELGEGPPLVLLHGLADSHRTFRRIAPALARTHRVLMPDLPGHGYSGRPADAPYDAPWFASTIAAWMEAAGAPHAAICGHSFGGGVALAMLRDHAARVERLALIAPGGLGREVTPWLRFSALPVARALLGSILARRIATRLAVSPLGPARFARPEPEELARYAVLAAMPGTAEALQRILDASLDVNGQRATFWEVVDAKTTLPPIAVLWGMLDPVLPFAHARRAAEKLLHASVHAYERCGHFPHLDCPERVLADLSAFLGDAERPCCRLVDCGDDGTQRAQWLDGLAMAAE